MDKAQIALDFLRSISDEYKSVAFIGRWRGSDVFADSTPREKGAPIAVGLPGAVIVDDDGIARVPLVSDITSSDFPSDPEWQDED